MDNLTTLSGTVVFPLPQNTVLYLGQGSIKAIFPAQIKEITFTDPRHSTTRRFEKIALTNADNQKLATIMGENISTCNGYTLYSLGCGIDPKARQSRWLRRRLKQETVIQGYTREEMANLNKKSYRKLWKLFLDKTFNARRPSEELLIVDNTTGQIVYTTGRLTLGRFFNPKKEDYNLLTLYKATAFGYGHPKRIQAYSQWMSDFIKSRPALTRINSQQEQQMVAISFKNIIP